MKKLFLVIMILTWCSTIIPEVIKKIKIQIHSHDQLVLIASTGIPLEDAYFDKKERTISLFVNEHELNKLKNASIQYLVEIEDWAMHYKSRPTMTASEINNSLKKSSLETNVNEFDYGSMGGFYTLEEVYNKLDSMHLKYPEIITNKNEIGKSFQKRPIYAIKISDNPDIDEDEPEVFYNSLIHAREPQGMMTVIYFMYYLLENYHTDPSVKYLVDNRELYFVPAINPDGYEYNRFLQPDGGGMWRKNRHGAGIDLNRNFGYMWGYDNNGSSPDTAHQTYRGISPFSEPETQAIRDFCNSRKFKTALNYHSYGNYLIYPWGYINQLTPDSLVFNEISYDMTSYNNYLAGTGYETVNYPTNGDADDWMYGEQSSKNEIFSMTPEVGNNMDGFWPTMDRIIPLAQENLNPNLYLAWVSGEFVKLSTYKLDKEYYMPGDTAALTLKIKNKGLSDAEDIKVQISPLTNNVEVDKPEFTTEKILSRKETELDQVQLTLSNDIKVTDLPSVVIKILTGNTLMSVDTVTLNIGKPEYVFMDKAENFDSLWVIGGSLNWELSTKDFNSSPSSYSNSDTERGSYVKNDNSYFILKKALDISGLNHPYLSFYTRFEIEKNWDYGQIRVSTNNGINWIPVRGKYSKNGSGNFQPLSEPIYDGNQEEWVKEEIDLLPYRSDNFKIRFDFHSDGYDEKEGWYIDDIGIFYKSLNTVGVENNRAISSFLLEQNYPNPFNPETKISYQLPKSELVSLKVYDMLGKEVSVLINDKLQTQGKYSISFNANNLGSGVYFYVLETQSFRSVKKMILLR